MREVYISVQDLYRDRLDKYLIFIGNRLDQSQVWLIHWHGHVSVRNVKSNGSKPESLFWWFEHPYNGCGLRKFLHAGSENVEKIPWTRWVIAKFVDCALWVGYRSRSWFDHERMFPKVIAASDRKKVHLIQIRIFDRSTLL